MKMIRELMMMVVLMVHQILSVGDRSYGRAVRLTTNWEDELLVMPLLEELVTGGWEGPVPETEMLAVTRSRTEQR